MKHSVQSGDDVLIPPQWSSAVVLESLYCRRCGYDLRGLRADSRCPECGLLIWASVQHTVDPAVSRLPSIRNPKAVGNALLALSVCMLLSVLWVFAPEILEMVVPDSRIRAWNQIGAFHVLTISIAAVFAAAMLLAVRTLAPPRGQEVGGTVWHDIWRIALGLTGWIVAAALWLEFRHQIGISGIRQQIGIHLAAAAFATIALIGLRGVFNIIGYRSREYRRSHAGRQNVELIIAAIIAGLVASLIYYAGVLRWVPADVQFISRTVVWASHLMVVIGLAYLVLNAWWIRRSLSKPPPMLDQVLVPDLPPDTWIPDRED